MIRMMLDCVISTRSSVIQTIYCNVGLKCFSFHLRKCLFTIIVTYVYFTQISQSSVKMHLQCGAIYNNHITANCLQSVPVKEFWKSVNNWRRYGQKLVPRFLLTHPVVVVDIIKIKTVYSSLIRKNPSQSYGASPAIWHHTVLPATSHRWMQPHLNLSQTGRQ